MDDDLSAAKVCQAMVLMPETKALLKPEYDARTFMRVLVDNQLFADAIRFLALCLPIRKGLWWACLCVRHSVAETPAERDALYAAVQLTQEPTDERKRICAKAAETASLETPAGCVAMAASRWNMPDLRPGRLVGAAVLISATRCSPVEQHFVDFINIGLDVDAGKLPWTAEA